MPDAHACGKLPLSLLVDKSLRQTIEAFELEIFWVPCDLSLQTHDCCNDYVTVKAQFVEAVFDIC